MSFARNPDAVHVRAPGKINVYLGVGPRHDDGYHALATVFQAVSLYEDVYASASDDFSIDVVGDVDISGVPLDDRNLALRAAKLLAQTAGVTQGVHSQGLEYDPAHPIDRNYVENVWGEKSGVLFVTMNIPGGSNNDTDPWYGAPAMSPAQAQEVADRTAADLRWLDTAFKQASTDGAAAVVIMVQADMWDLDGKTASHIAQYKQFIDRIAANTKTFGKPVLLINGDSHVYRSDNPLKAGSPCVMETGQGVQTAACTDDAYANQPNGYDVANFHRIVVHGSTSPLEWLKLAVDPSANAANGASAFGPFSWTRVQP